MPREGVKDSVFPIHEGSTDRGKWQTRTSIRLCLGGAGMDECVSKTFEYCRVQDFFREIRFVRGIQGKFPTKPPSDPILHPTSSPEIPSQTKRNLFIPVIHNRSA